MNQRLNEILAPARAIVNPPIPTHADIPVFPPDAKSIRTYYLWSNGRVSQRRPLIPFVVDTVQAETTEEARGCFKIRYGKTHNLVVF